MPPGAPVWGRAVLVLLLIALIGAVYLGNRLAFGAEPFDAVAGLFTTAALVTFGGAYAVLPLWPSRPLRSAGSRPPRC